MLEETAVSVNSLTQLHEASTPILQIKQATINIAIASNQAKPKIDPKIPTKTIAELYVSALA